MGIQLNTDGRFEQIVGDGATSILGGTRSLLTYGFTNSVSVGAFSDLTLAIKTSISAAVSMSASMGPSYAFSFKDDALMGNSGGFNHRTSYVGNVGADTKAKARIARLRNTAKIAILVQTAAMAALAGTTIAAAATQSPDKDKGEVLNFPGTTFPLGYVTSIVTLFASITPLMLLTMQKLGKLDQGNQPNSVLSMNSESATFLGARSSNGSGAAGLRLDESGAELSTAEGLEFHKPKGGTTVTQFDKDAEDAGGARLRLNIDGQIQVWGGGSDFTISGNSRQEAEGYSFYITEQGKDTNSKFTIGKASTYISANDRSTFLVHEDAGVNARTGQSFVTLNSDSASMGQTGSTVTCESSSIEIKAGGQKITIDGSGIKLGDAITILSPGAPGGPAPQLNQIQEAEKKQDGKDKDEASALDADNQKQQAAQSTLKMSKDALIALQAQLNELDNKTN